MMPERGDRIDDEGTVVDEEPLTGKIRVWWDAEENATWGDARDYMLLADGQWISKDRP